MPKKLTQEPIACAYFVWNIGPSSKSAIYHADGRSNDIDVGRHSLGTRDRKEAIEALRQLDATMAVQHGRANPSILHQPQTTLTLDEGIKLYTESVALPRSLGGASATTQKRYRAVFDKLKAFAALRHVRSWHEITKGFLKDYGKWLHDHNRAPRTLYLEITTVKQAIAWLIREGHLPESAKIDLTVQKVTDTDTYCYTSDEVAAILAHCFAHNDLHWLGNVVVGLAYTGLRIGELAQLRWTAIDLDANVLRVIDNTGTTARNSKLTQVTTKTHRSRTLPIHPEFRHVLDVMTRHPDGRVFHGPLGGLLKPDTVRRILIDSVLTPLKPRFPGQPGARSFKDGRLHSLRHFFCSKCAADGVPEQVVMKWLGHSNSRMVQHYYHLHDEESQRQIQKLKPVGDPITAS